MVDGRGMAVSSLLGLGVRVLVEYYLQLRINPDKRWHQHGTILCVGSYLRNIRVTGINL